LPEPCTYGAIGAELETKLIVTFPHGDEPDEDHLPLLEAPDYGLRLVVDRKIFHYGVTDARLYPYRKIAVDQGIPKPQESEKWIVELVVGPVEVLPGDTGRHKKQTSLETVNHLLTWLRNARRTDGSFRGTPLADLLPLGDFQFQLTPLGEQAEIVPPWGDEAPAEFDNALYVHYTVGMNPAGVFALLEWLQPRVQHNQSVANLLSQGLKFGTHLAMWMVDAPGGPPLTANDFDNEPDFEIIRGFGALVCMLFTAHVVHPIIGRNWVKNLLAAVPRHPPAAIRRRLPSRVQAFLTNNAEQITAAMERHFRSHWPDIEEQLSNALDLSADHEFTDLFAHQTEWAEGLSGRKILDDALGTAPRGEEVLIALMRTEMNLVLEDLDTNEGALDVPVILMELRHLNSSETRRQFTFPQFEQQFTEVEQEALSIYQKTSWKDRAAILPPVLPLQSGASPDPAPSNQLWTFQPDDTDHNVTPILAQYVMSHSPAASHEAAVDRHDTPDTLRPASGAGDPALSLPQPLSHASRGVPASQRDQDHATPPGSARGRRRKHPTDPTDPTEYERSEPTPKRPRNHSPEPDHTTAGADYTTTADNPTGHRSHPQPWETSPPTIDLTTQESRRAFAELFEDVYGKDPDNLHQTDLRNLIHHLASQGRIDSIPNSAHELALLYAGHFQEATIPTEIAKHIQSWLDDLNSPHQSQHDTEETQILTPRSADELFGGKPGTDPYFHDVRVGPLRPVRRTAQQDPTLPLGGSSAAHTTTAPLLDPSTSREARGVDESRLHNTGAHGDDVTSPARYLPSLAMRPGAPQVMGGLGARTPDGVGRPSTSTAAGPSSSQWSGSRYVPEGSSALSSVSEAHADPRPGSEPLTRGATESAFARLAMSPAKGGRDADSDGREEPVKRSRLGEPQPAGTTETTGGRGGNQTLQDRAAPGTYERDRLDGDRSGWRLSETYESVDGVDDEVLAAAKDLLLARVSALPDWVPGAEDCFRRVSEVVRLLAAAAGSVGDAAMANNTQGLAEWINARFRPGAVGQLSALKIGAWTVVWIEFPNRPAHVVLVLRPSKNKYQVVDAQRQDNPIISTVNTADALWFDGTIQLPVSDSGRLVQFAPTPPGDPYPYRRVESTHSLPPPSATVRALLASTTSITPGMQASGRGDPHHPQSRPLDDEQVQAQLGAWGMSVDQNQNDRFPSLLEVLRLGELRHGAGQTSRPSAPPLRPTGVSPMPRSMSWQDSRPPPWWIPRAAAKPKANPEAKP
jgi:hypothetical protein